MRVIFETPPVTMDIAQKLDPNQPSGRAFLRVIQFDPGEDPPPMPNERAARLITRTLAEIRRESEVGGRVIVSPPPRSRLAGRIGPYEIPQSILSELPDSTRLQVLWIFQA